MTTRVDDLSATDQGTSAGRRGSPHGAREAVRSVCPFLVAADGDWRSIHPTRDHRCGATQPPVAPAPAKQRDLCLTPLHDGCATYRAAIDVRTASREPGAAHDGLWPEAGAPVLALESVRTRGGVLGGASTRGGQALLVGLMVLAFLVLVIARATPPSSGGGSMIAPGARIASPVASATSSPAVSASVSPSPAPTATPSPAPSATPTASPAPTPRATATATPAGSTTYKVRSGDTLSAIATRYGTTVKKLKLANGLTSNTIRPGQVLVIP